MADTPHVTIVGGGITGLSAALDLIDHSIDVTVVERTSRLGGKIAEVDLGDIRCPTAPDNFLTRRSEVSDLARRLGLEGRLIHPVARSPRIVRDGQLHRLPPNVLGLPATVAIDQTGLLSADAARRAEREQHTPRPVPTADETVGALVRRRFGDEVLEYLVDPLLGGINAGDSDRLSIESGVPQIHELISSGGSIVDAARDHLSARASDVGPVFTGMAGGLTRLVDAVHRELEHSPRAELRLECDPTVSRSDHGWEVDGRPTDHVLLTAPAYAAAEILDACASDVAERLRAVPYASVGVVIVVLPAGAIPIDDAISGVLVPRQEGLLVTAVSFASHKWPELASGDRQVLRVSVGRRTDERWLTMDDDEIATAVRSDLEAIFGVTIPDAPAYVTRWKRALPQYELGHRERVARIDEATRTLPGLHLTGAWRDGLGLPACVASGSLAAAAIVG